MELLHQSVESPIDLITVLSPKSGYKDATRVARYAQKSNCALRKAVLSLSLMSEEEFEEEPWNLI